MSHLLIRADADFEIGTGHVMRCLALAQAWRDSGGEACFLMAEGVPALEERLRKEQMKVQRMTFPPGSKEDAAATLDLALAENAAAIVVDGYRFSADYHKALHGSGPALLCLDDYGHAGHYCSDYVLNQNISATESLYRDREPCTRLLLGTQYALLRGEFAVWRDWERKFPAQAGHILITLGGSDPQNMTLQVIQALDAVEAKDIEALVLAGAANPYYDQLRESCEQASHRFRLESNAGNMPELMAWADLAISGAGSTSWELAFMGLPSLLLILGKDQQGIAEGLAREGSALNLGWHEDLRMDSLTHAAEDLIHSPDKRRRMSERGRALVDGCGAERIVNLIRGAAT
ncbi:MAG: UDP-2,4-diacetamido-2,4,6-trideoxy-beta-L-altropyranose hydrolase [Candidatus Sumerlaeota bacterium]|nr:UDP-2,4-diacetamido-2,4,6-trideoxy-beta-L-altropyranose hydrolase [Candidatus Sumerlaeota bacterium]